MSKSKPQAIDKFELVTEQICTLLDQGCKPWEKPWFAVKPCNLVSGHIYSGYNPLLASISMLIYGYDQPYFLGLSQGKELGWKLVKGSKSTWIKFGGKIAKDVEANGETKTEYRSAFKWHNVFNAQCWDDSESDHKIAHYLTKLDTPLPITPNQRIERVEEFVSKQEPRITHGGDNAFYSIQLDSIMLPELTAFTSTEAYYATLIHELGHSTGHPSRLNRDMTGGFRSQKYAYEELVAELTAAFVCNEHQLSSQLESHASYIESWLGALKGDKQYFFRAVRDAKKAADYLLERAGLTVNASND